jgi:hypothetical protein
VLRNGVLENPHCVSLMHFLLPPKQDCQPLWLTAPDGRKFEFAGVRDILAGKIAAEDALQPPGAAGMSNSKQSGLFASQLCGRA